MKKHHFTRMKESTLLKIAEEQISARALTTPAGWNTEKAEIYDRRTDMFLIGGEYKFHYSNRVGDWWCGASYLVGQDEGQLFAVRVPRTCNSITAALEFITPGPVRKAREKGREVFRQGDIFFIEMRLPEDDMSALRWTRHEYRRYENAGDPEWYRQIVHPQHSAVVLTRGKHYRAFQSTQVNGRAGD